MGPNCTHKVLIIEAEEGLTTELASVMPEAGGWSYRGRSHGPRKTGGLCQWEKARGLILP